MAKIFICYRREDTKWPAQTIYNYLADHFGKESVVFDVDSIPFGIDFREYLNNAVSKCDIFLAVMGEKWLEFLKKRLNKPNDFVRIEIQAALERNIPVVPVCIGDASVPGEENLPSEIAGLSYKQAVEISAGPDLKIHLKRLVEGLEYLLAELKVEVESKQKEIEEKATRERIAELKSTADEEQKLKKVEEKRKKKEARAKSEAEEKEQTQKEEKKRRNDEERKLKTTKQWYAELVEKKWFKRIISVHLFEETHVIEINGRKFGLKLRYGVDGEVPLKKCSWPTKIYVTDGSINRKLTFWAKFPNDITITVDRKVLYCESPE